MREIHCTDCKRLVDSFIHSDCYTPRFVGDYAVLTVLGRVFARKEEVF